MKQRLRNVWSLLTFAFHASVAVCIERRAIVSWERSFKKVTVSVTFYNHLTPAEFAMLPYEEQQAIVEAEEGTGGKRHA